VSEAYTRIDHNILYYTLFRIHARAKSYYEAVAVGYSRFSDVIRERDGRAWCM